MISSRRFPPAAAIALALFAILPGYLAFADDTPQAPYTVKDLNEQMVMGLAWVQTSAEYRELCY